MPDALLDSIKMDATREQFLLDEIAGMVPTQTTDPGGLNETTTFTCDARGNRLTSKDPLNRTASFAYDLRGNLVTTTLPDTRQQTATYDARNNVQDMQTSLRGIANRAKMDQEARFAPRAAAARP